MWARVARKLYSPPLVRDQRLPESDGGEARNVVHEPSHGTHQGQRVHRTPEDDGHAFRGALTALATLPAGRQLTLRWVDEE